MPETKEELMRRYPGIDPNYFDPARGVPWAWGAVGVDPRTGAGINDLGFTERLPEHWNAPYVQYLAERKVAGYNQRLREQARDTLRQGLTNLQAYRPGGAAAMASPFYSNIANVQMASQVDAPDLMFNWRSHEAYKARKRARRERWTNLAATAIKAGATIAASAVGGPLAGAGVALGTGLGAGQGGSQTTEQAKGGLPGTTVEKGLQLAPGAASQQAGTQPPGAPRPPAGGLPEQGAPAGGAAPQAGMAPSGPQGPPAPSAGGAPAGGAPSGGAPEVGGPGGPTAPGPRGPGSPATGPMMQAGIVPPAPGGTNVAAMDAADRVADQPVALVEDLAMQTGGTPMSMIADVMELEPDIFDEDRFDWYEQGLERVAMTLMS